jgi:hypothetical protein
LHCGVESIFIRKGREGGNELPTLTISAKDQAGNTLAGDKEISFTTGEVPRLVSSTPENRATDIEVKPFEITLVFSKPMDTTTVKVIATLEPVTFLSTVNPGRSPGVLRTPF